MRSLILPLLGAIALAGAILLGAASVGRPIAAPPWRPGRARMVRGLLHHLLPQHRLLRPHVGSASAVDPGSSRRSAAANGRSTARRRAARWRTRSGGGRRPGRPLPAIPSLSCLPPLCAARGDGESPFQAEAVG